MASRLDPQPKMKELLEVVKDTYEAKIVIPDFQRNFVWGREKIEELLSSILQGFFIGTFLFLETKPQEPIFPYDVVWGLKQVNGHGSPHQHSMVDLVLDGQQRIASLFYALYAPEVKLKRKSKYPYRFFWKLEPAIEGNIDDAIKGISTQDRKGMAKMNELVRSDRSLPISFLKNPGEFRRWLFREQKVLNNNQEDRIAEIYGNLEKFRIPIIPLNSEFGTDNIVTIFERINRTGVNLSLFDLAVARLYPKGIRLRKDWKNFQSEHKQGAFNVAKEEYLLKEIALLEGKEPRRGKLLDILGDLDVPVFEQRWKEAVDGIALAYKRISKDEYGALDKNRIPYSTILMPLGVLLSHLKETSAGQEAYRKIDRWYWASVFTRRYDSSVDTTSHQDVSELVKWIGEQREPKWIQKFHINEDDLDVGESRSAIYRGLMCLIVRNEARDFLTGQKAILNECDDDHIFPQAQYKHKDGVDSIFNKTLLSKETNRAIKRCKHPSQFFKECLKEHGNDERRLLKTLRSHFISKEAYEALVKDDFEKFIYERSKELKKAVEKAVRT